MAICVRCSQCDRILVVEQCEINDNGDISLAVEPCPGYFLEGYKAGCKICEFGKIYEVDKITKDLTMALGRWSEGKPGKVENS